MSIVPLHPTAGPFTSSTSDRAHAVIDLLPVYLELAGRIANTEFVPTALRRRPEAVLAALMSGAERGLGPMESLRSINVIEGRPSLSAEAMRALVLAAGHEIEIVETTAVKATLVGRRAGSDSTSPAFTWTMDRARRARLANKDNWVKYPESMLLARASTDLCRAVFPDVIAGLASTEEVTDERALAVEQPMTSRRAPARRGVASVPAAPQLAAGTHAGEESSGFAGSSPAPPRHPPVIDVELAGESDSGEPDDLDEIPGSDQPTWGTPPPAKTKAKKAAAPPPQTHAHDPSLAKRLHAEITQAFPDATASTRDHFRHALVAVVTRKRPDGPITSSSFLDLEEQLALSEILARIQGGQATVEFVGPDDNLVEIHASTWRYTVTLDPPGVVWQRDDESTGTDADPPDQPEETEHAEPV